jgi:hypothetical protein
MIEKILERLEELKVDSSCNDCPYAETCDKVQETASSKTDLCGATMKALAIQIVQEVAKEYGNGWIPCSERLPEEQDEYLVWWTADGFKGKCFYEIVEYSPEEGWIGKIPQAPFGKYTVIAWMPLPSAPYQKGE